LAFGTKSTTEKISACHAILNNAADAAKGWCQFTKKPSNQQISKYRHLHKFVFPHKSYTNC